MDFFEQQAKAHRKTKWLVIYFVMAVAAMIAAITEGSNPNITWTPVRRE